MVDPTRLTRGYDASDPELTPENQRQQPTDSATQRIDARLGTTTKRRRKEKETRNHETRTRPTWTGTRRGVGTLGRWYRIGNKAGRRIGRPRTLVASCRKGLASRGAKRNPTQNNENRRQNRHRITPLFAPCHEREEEKYALGSKR